MCGNLLRKCLLVSELLIECSEKVGAGMGRFEQLLIDRKKLSLKTARAGLLRGELAKLAGLSSAPIADAFAGRPIGVKAARKIAKALGVDLAKLLAAESESAVGGAHRQAVA